MGVRIGVPHPVGLLAIAVDRVVPDAQIAETTSLVFLLGRIVSKGGDL